jgi:hypothetical protein
MKTLLKGVDTRAIVEHVENLSQAKYHFDDGNPHDSFVFLTNMLKACGNCNEAFYLKLKRNVFCKSCSSETCAEQSVVGSVDITVPDGDISLNFSRCVLNAMTWKRDEVDCETGTCKQCKKQNSLEETVTRSFTDETRLIIVRVLWYFKAAGMMLKATAAFQPLNSDAIIVNGKRLNVVAAVMYTHDSEDCENGHYWCIRKGSNDTWLKLDENCPAERCDFPMTLDKVYYLICELEDCPYELEPVGLKEISHENMDENVILRIVQNWHNTGLNRNSVYYDVPVVSCGQEGRNARSVMWERLAGDVFTVYDVSGDGNCLYRAVSLAVYGTENKHLVFRRMAVDWIRDHWQQLDRTMLISVMIDMKEQIIVRTEELDRSELLKRLNEWAELLQIEEEFKKALIEMCSYLKQSRVWGGEESLQYLSKALDVSIVVIDVTTGVVWRTLADEPVKKAELYLKFIGANHYQLMEPNGKPKMRLKLPECGLF